MKTYRVAILGCRKRGTAAGRAYHAHPRTQVVGLCDLVQEARDALGDELGVSSRFADLDEMIRQAQPDIVVIPTATQLHYELAMRVLEHGVSIDVEKPMCVDLEQADAVMAKAAAKGVQVAVHHQGRVGAAMHAVEHAFRAGHIGDLRYIFSSGKGYYGGSGLMNIGPHALNNVIKFAGPCRSVSAVAVTGGHPITPDDVLTAPYGMGTIAGENITATLQFDGNVTATVLQHRFPTRSGSAYMTELYGTEGRLLKNGGAWSSPQPHLLPGEAHGNWQRLEPVYPDHYDPNGSAAADEYWFVEEWVRALDEGRDHECSGADGLHALEIMMGVFESAAYGRRVDLPQPQRDHPLLRWRREHGLDDPTPLPWPYRDWVVVEDRRLGRVS